MPLDTALTRRLGLAYPIIQAPLAGGGDTPELVAAVSNAGGIGFIGAAYLSPTQIAETARAVRAKTARPFGINLFAPVPAPAPPGDPAPALARVAPFFAELGLPAPGLPSSAGLDFREQLSAALESAAAAFSFTLGLLPEDAMTGAKARGMMLLGTATTVAEALLLERAGVDAVVLQGAEAGGHRASFAHAVDQALIGTMALVPQAADALSVPVIASGGIMDGRGLAAALALGAAGAQLGTAFLTCTEAGVPEAYKAAILAASEDATRLTRAFSGRMARGIANRFMAAIDAGDAILPFPLQNALTRPLRLAAAQQGKGDYLSLWAGQGVRLARRQSAAALVTRLAAEAEGVVARLAGREG
ncbi:MAG TPA: nitronate monooxygenase [Stellaceae bacterium]|nr:nitronate monooxygenase [Stellaceae bacterium]